MTPLIYDSTIAALLSTCISQTSLKNVTMLIQLKLFSR